VPERTVHVVLVASLLTASCGDDASSASAVDVDDFCAGWVSALCDSAARCTCAVDAPTCEMRAAAACVLDRGRPTREMVDTGALPYDPVAAGRYIDAVAATPCDERPSLCGTTGPCLGLGKEGDACGATIGCAANLACIDGSCVAPAADGATCTDAAGCASGHCERGQCEPAAAVGEPCAAESECASGNCDFGTGRCREKEPEGGLCTEHSECESGYCDRDLELGAGSCQPLVPTGGSCDEDPQCVEGACFSGACGVALCDDIVE
jgi:hypothetical protein